MNNPPQTLQNYFNNPSLLPCNLDQWGVISVEGSDAASFLQNQLTNSVLGLALTLPELQAYGHSATRLVGYCSPKGRLLASAWTGLFPSNVDSGGRFILFISKDIAASTTKRLSMYVLRSKVKVIDLSAEWAVCGLFGSDAQIAGIKTNVNEFGLRLPDVLINDQSVARLLIARPKEELIHEQDSGEALKVWNSLEVFSAIPRIVLATQEQFVPQMINFESVAGVDFKKGCYPGQEIVARSQYRGAIKRRLQLAHLKDASLNEDSYAPGTELYHDGDPTQPAGMIVLSARHPAEPDRIDMQIECKLDALEKGEIHLGSAVGPVLKIDKLPYSLLEI